MRGWRIWLVAILIVITGALVYFLLPSLDNASAYEGTELSGEASDFKLMNQNGDVVRLSDFRGKVVVLTFMDSKCEDTCPLTAAQLRQTYRAFKPSEADRVVFIGINVNVQANAVSDVYEISQSWHLDELPNWHFLTGSAGELAPVGSDYGVAAVPQPSGEIIHTPGVFIIDGAGQRRWYISTPYSEDGNTESTLPLSELLIYQIRKIL